MTMPSYILETVSKSSRKCSKIYQDFSAFQPQKLDGVPEVRWRTVRKTGFLKNSCMIHLSIQCYLTDEKVS